MQDAETGSAGLQPAPAMPHPADDLVAKRDYVALYVGLSWPDYAASFENLRQGRFAPSWSFTIFLFPWIWLVYRTMLPLGIAVWVADLVSFSALGSWSAAVVLPISIFFAAYGRLLFIKHAIKKVDDALATARSHQEAVDAIKDQGIAKGFALFGTVIAMLVVAGMLFEHLG